MKNPIAVIKKLLPLLAFWLVVNAAPVLAFAGTSGAKDLKTTCQTSCHQAENLIKAHRQKTTQEKCRACHVGEISEKAGNPFKRHPATPDNSHLNRRVRSPRPPQLIARPVAASLKKSSPKAPPIASMAHVPAGEFIMGSNERWDDESPEHISSTGAFYIDLYEVTNSDYKKFKDATQRPAPFHWPNGEIARDQDNHPVVYVSWFDARDYCQWNGKRLPTEQEWEKAARGVAGDIYPWGNIWSLDKSNNPYKHSTGTEPVGSYANGQSPYGLLDMSGNVWEWVDSYYLPHPGNTIAKVEYGTDKRILKGGSWFDCLSYGCGLSAPTFNRSFFNPEVKNNSFGFRCAQSP